MPSRLLSDLPSHERRRSPGIVLVVQMRSGNCSASLTDVVASVADGESLRRGDGAEGLPALWVAENNNCEVLVRRHMEGKLWALGERIGTGEATRTGGNTSSVCC
jgi:hypothetical protein